MVYLKLIHEPSGLVAVCNDEISEHRAEAKALKELEIKVAEWKK